MKYYGIVMLFFCSWCVAHQEELFLQGNKHYVQCEHEKALASYQLIERKGPAAWYNMGNCYYHLQQYPIAIACWKRAFKGASSAMLHAIDKNCATLYCKIGKEFAITKRHYLMRWFMQKVMNIPLLWWQLSLLCSLIILLLILPSLFIHARYFSALALMIATCMFTMSFVVRFVGESKKYAIVMHDKAPIRAGPAQDYAVIETSRVLDEFQVIAESDDWIKVSGGVKRGWMPVDAVEIIVAPFV